MEGIRMVNVRHAGYIERGHKKFDSEVFPGNIR
jgi:hypothetical protein